jgi:hypothetical protein
MMWPATDNPASCEIRSDIHLLRGKNTSATEIHREFARAVYGQIVMSEGTARQWCRMHIMKNEVAGRSVVNGDLVVLK